MIQPRIREPDGVGVAPSGKRISEGSEGYTPTGTIPEGGNRSAQAREQEKKPRGKEDAKILSPEELEQEFERITHEVIQRIHEHSFRILGNPKDPLSGEVLATQVHLIGFIAQRLRRGEQEQVEAALGHLKILEEYWEFRASRSVAGNNQAKQSIPQELVEAFYNIKNVSGKMSKKSQTGKIRKALSKGNALGLYEAIKERYIIEGEGLEEHGDIEQEEPIKASEADQKESKEIGNAISYLDAVAEFARNRFQGITTVTEAQLHLYAFMAHYINPAEKGQVFRNMVYEGIPELPREDKELESIVIEALELGNEPVIYYLAKIVDYYRLTNYLKLSEQRLTEMEEFKTFVQRTKDGIPYSLRILADEFRKNEGIAQDEQAMREALAKGIEEIKTLLIASVTKGERVLIPDKMYFATQFAAIVPTLIMGGMKFTIHWNTFTADLENRRVYDFSCIYCKAFAGLGVAIRDYIFGDYESEMWKWLLSEIEAVGYGAWRNMSLEQLPVIESIMQYQQAFSQLNPLFKEQKLYDRIHFEALARNYLIAMALQVVFNMRDKDQERLKRRIEENFWPEDTDMPEISSRVLSAIYHSLDFPNILQLKTQSIREIEFELPIIGRLNYKWEASEQQITPYTKELLASYRERMEFLREWHRKERAEQQRLLEEQRRREFEAQVKSVIETLVPGAGEAIQIVEQAPEDLEPYEELAQTLEVSSEVVGVAVESVADYLQRRLRELLENASLGRLAFVSLQLDDFARFYEKIATKLQGEFSEVGSPESMPREIPTSSGQVTPFVSVNQRLRDVFVGIVEDEIGREEAEQITAHFLNEPRVAEMVRSLIEYWLENWRKRRLEELNIDNLRTKIMTVITSNGQGLVPTDINKLDERIELFTRELVKDEQEVLEVLVASILDEFKHALKDGISIAITEVSVQEKRRKKRRRKAKKKSPAGRRSPKGRKGRRPFDYLEGDYPDDF